MQSVISTMTPLADDIAISAKEQEGGGTAFSTNEQNTDLITKLLNESLVRGKASLTSTDPLACGKATLSRDTTPETPDVTNVIAKLLKESLARSKRSSATSGKSKNT
jgi:hypothetical protein